MALNIQVVAFYTLGPYAEEAKKLIDSCDSFGVQLDISPLPQPKKSIAGWQSWHDVVSFKPKFVLSMLEKHIDKDGILYTDADSTFAHYPDWRVFDDCHVAFHKFKRSPNHAEEFLTGTMFFAVTPKVHDFVKHWSDVTPPFRHKFTPEQDSLKSIWGQWGEVLEHRDPGPEWCWIYDDFPKIYRGQRTPIVVHHQASRRLRS